VLCFALAQKQCCVLDTWVSLFCLQAGGLLTKNLANHHPANKQLFLSDPAK
jgi:hypothetical protein